MPKFVLQIFNAVYTRNIIPTPIVTQKIRTKAGSLGIYPRIHRYKIRYEAGNWTMENGIISNDDTLRWYIDFISLIRNWKKNLKN